MSRQTPSLRAITAFEAAARHESFAKAAQELNLTQSAISHSMRGLEERLDAKLFARRGRNVALTDEGRSLAARLRVSMILLAQAFDGVTARDQTERLVIGVRSALAHRSLIRRCKDLASALPGLCLDVRPDLGVGAVQTGEADLVIDYGAGAYAGLASRILEREAVFPVAAPDLEVDPDRLGRSPLIENSEHAWGLWFGRLRAPGAPRTPALTVCDWRLAVDAAKAGLGVCLASDSLVAEELLSGELVRLGADAMPALHACHLVWRAHGPNVRRVGRFVDWLLDQEIETRGADRLGTEAALSRARAA